ILRVEGAHFINHALIANPVHESFNSLNVDWCDKWIFRSFHWQMKSDSEHIHCIDTQQESMEYSEAQHNYCISQWYGILELVEQLELLVEPCEILYDDMK
ncbi:hypothetical protein Tco_0147232, partial [Tanacetum coccineum]